MNIKNIDDIKGTIEKLLALAESPNENEAKAALLKARELMAKYKLHPQEVSQKQDARVIRRTVGISCTKMTNTWAVWLSGIIAAHYCCQAYRNRNLGAKKVEIGFVGLEDDFEICERIFKYAFDCVDAQCKKIRADHKEGWPPAIIRQMVNSYGYGFCKGLEAAYEAQDCEHQEWGLVLSTPQAVVDAMSDIGKPSSYGRVNTGEDYRKFNTQGYEDGMKFDPSTKLKRKRAF